MILDLFAGPGGWDVGAKRLGLDPIGIEWEPNACATRAAAGHLTIRADVAAYPTEPFRDVAGLIASPPCQDWSLGGLREGFAAIRGQLVREVPRWVEALGPEWVACEQVPEVLPIWKIYARTFEEWGYHVWAGVLDTKDFGLPQARQRAVLLARRGQVLHLPQPTHGATREDLFGETLEPYVSASAVVGSEGYLAFPRLAINEPATVDGYRRRDFVRTNRPCKTVTGTVRSWGLYAERSKDSFIRKVTLAEAGELQGFSIDYPWRGSHRAISQQIGNAVPPLLAEKLLACVMISDG